MYRHEGKRPWSGSEQGGYPKKSKPEKSAYSVIYADHHKEGRHVLVGKKNINAQWWNYKQNKDIVRNNPGQHVFPGGKTEGSSITERAATEFKEEVGLDVDLNQRRINRHLKDPVKGSIASVLSHQEFSHKDFDVLYIETDKEGLNKIADTFSIMKASDDVAHNANKHQNKYRKDDELGSLYAMPFGNAKDVFKHENSVPPPIPSEHSARLGRYARSTDWFTIALNNIPEQSDISQPKGNIGSSSSSGAQ